MEPLATVADLRKHWSALPVDKEPEAEQKLLEASVIVRSLFSVDARIRSGKLMRETAVFVVCDMVKTALDIDETDIPADVTQLSFGAGPHTQSYSFKDRDGKLFFTRLHRQMLTGGGARSRKAFMIMPGM